MAWCGARPPCPRPDRRRTLPRWPASGPSCPTAARSTRTGRRCSTRYGDGSRRARVWSALRAGPVVRALAGDARPLSEGYLVVRDGERFLEGYVDLLVDGGPDGLTVLDYKTDRARTEEEKAAKWVHYAPQLAAYARAVERVTDRACPGQQQLRLRPPGWGAPAVAARPVVVSGPLATIGDPHKESRWLLVLRGHGAFARQGARP